MSPPNTNGLTPNQQSVLDFIVVQVNQKGYPPSIREIGKSTGISSLRGVTLQLDALSQKGFIKRSPVARGITLLGLNGTNNNVTNVKEPLEENRSSAS